MTTLSISLDLLPALHKQLPTARDMLAMLRGNFGFNVNIVGSMSDAQLLRMADACRFLSNNLPPATIKARSIRDAATAGARRMSG